MSLSASSFKVDPNNYLGHNYQDFLSQIYALALSKPNDYFELRRKIVEISGTVFFIVNII